MAERGKRQRADALTGWPGTQNGLLQWANKSRETIAECRPMQLFNCQSVKHVAEKRQHNFIQKYFASRNGFYELFAVGLSLRMCGECCE